MTARRLAALAAITALALAFLATTPGALAAGVRTPSPPGSTPPGTGSPPPPQQVICSTSKPSWVWQQADNVPVISKANGFNTSGQKFCIEAAGTFTSPGPPGFRVVTDLARTGNWQAYPYTAVGCAYGLCSRGTLLPVQVRKLPPWLSTSFSWRGNGAPGSWNAAYDIWFDHHSQIRTEDNAVELMIWLKSNTGLNSAFHLARAGRHLFWWTTWLHCDPAGICFHYVQFRFTTPRLARQWRWATLHGVRGLWLMPFIRFLEHRKLLAATDWLTSVHAGFEIVRGGRGLQTTWFNVHGVTG